MLKKIFIFTAALFSFHTMADSSEALMLTIVKMEAKFVGEGQRLSKYRIKATDDLERKLELTCQTESGSSISAKFTPKNITLNHKFFLNTHFLGLNHEFIKVNKSYHLMKHMCTNLRVIADQVSESNPIYIHLYFEKEFFLIDLAQTDITRP